MPLLPAPAVCDEVQSARSLSYEAVIGDLRNHDNSTPLDEEKSPLEAWCCNFCGGRNQLDDMDCYEIPREANVEYLLSPAPSVNVGEELQYNVVFCIGMISWSKSTSFNSS